MFRHSSGDSAPRPCWRISRHSYGEDGPSTASTMSNSVISAAGRP
ncbi:hypothetical protein [Actinomadura atramentaria]|nr:hypothetical protein [Actinomadura atramentaria]